MAEDYSLLVKACVPMTHSPFGQCGSLFVPVMHTNVKLG